MSTNDWKKRLNVVYSTNPDFEYETPSQEEIGAVDPSKQRLRIALDKRNRGGKQVTIVADFKGDEQGRKELCKLLKTKCGVGGAVKENEIIIQGDFREKIREILVAQGYHARII